MPTISELLRAFDFFVYAQDFKYLPDIAALIEHAERLVTKYVPDDGAAAPAKRRGSLVNVVDSATITGCQAAINELKANKLTKQEGRKIFEPLQTKVLAKLTLTL